MKKYLLEIEDHPYLSKIVARDVIELKSIKSTVEENKRLIIELSAKAEEHDYRFDSIEKDLAVVKKDIVDMKTDIVEMKTDIVGIKSQIGEILSILKNKI
jgi:chromosome segregation ATPase